MNRSFLYERFLISTGKRKTVPKQKIAEHICDLTGVYDAGEMIEKMKTPGESFSRTTVYRVIQELKECNLIREIMVDGRACYEVVR